MVCPLAIMAATRVKPRTSATQQYITVETKMDVSGVSKPNVKDKN